MKENSGENIKYGITTEVSTPKVQNMESGCTELRLVCPVAFGRSESTIRHVESVSGAKIRFLDDLSSDDCVLQITADSSSAAANRDNNQNVRREEEETWTAEQKALVRVYETIVRREAAGEQAEVVGDREVTCKMLIGRGLSKVFEKIESESGANVRVLAKDHFFAADDLLIQVIEKFESFFLFFLESCIEVPMWHRINHFTKSIFNYLLILCATSFCIIENYEFLLYVVLLTGIGIQIENVNNKPKRINETMLKELLHLGCVGD